MSSPITPRRFGPPPPGGCPEVHRVYAIVVDDAWRIAALQDGALPRLPAADASEDPEAALLEALRTQAGLEVEILHSLGAAAEAVTDARGEAVDEIGRYYVCRVKVGGSGPARFLPSTQLTRALPLASARYMVRRALGPC